MQTIGRYELIEKLGQGGMGAVYRARDTLLQRIVAVKVIATTIDQNEELRERFFREARAAGQLSHKNIITIHDLGEHEGQPYLAMEYLQGQDLLARMQSPQRMSLRRRVDIAIDICEGLDFAHVHGVVHRDIKPANIFITDSGMVKILDFGLARLVTSELTRSNMMMGTINYMAPEQIRGEKIDHRADIFSSAVVFYELLSGRRAFDADSFAATLYKILQEFPEPLQQIDPTIPSDLVRIIERALSKPRDERYQHMSEMLLELSLFRQQLAGMDSPAGGRMAPTELRTPSDKPYQVTPPIPLPPVATPLPVTGAPTPVSGPPLSTPPPSGVRAYLLPAIAVLALAIAAIAMWNSSRTSSNPPTAAAAPPSTPATPITEVMKSALTAFEAEDFATAERIANTVLARDPGNDSARQLRDRARAAAAAVEQGVQKARTLFAAGQYQEASSAAGEVLSVAPGNKEARQIMEDGAARSRGRGADDARAQVAHSRAAARTAGAPKLAAAAYGAASTSEREAERLYAAGKLGDATVKFYQASSLYRSAEVAAQNETTRRQAASRAESTPEKPVEVARTTSLPLPPATTPGGSGAPQTSGEGAAPPTPAPPPTTTAPTTTVPPTTTVAAPPAPAQPSAAELAAARDAAISDVLARYKAAVESRSLEALKRIWPGLPEQAMRDEFRQATSISVGIVDPRITGTNDTATVTFVRHYEAVKEGQRLQSQSNATMELRRNGNSWLIEQIKFIPRH
jgi:eukaryotic-like serine/threonine-protein kinase